MTLTPIRCLYCNGKSIEAQRTYTIVPPVHGLFQKHAIRPLPSWGLLRIHVLWSHRAIRPKKYAFSVSPLASFLACKINGFCVWICRTIFGRWFS